MSTVALPRWAVGLLVGVCAASLVSMAFLLGRITAPAPATEPAQGESVGPTPAAGVPESARPSSGELPDATTGALPAGLGSSDQPLASGSATAEPSVVGSQDAAGIAAYFRQMDAVATEAKASQDPQALARTILEQAVSGNTAGLEGLIATQRTLEIRLGQIAPPPSCREHHERSVRLFGRAIALLERTRTVTSGQGTLDFGDMAAEGRAIETEARQLDALANSIRRAAGLPVIP